MNSIPLNCEVVSSEGRAICDGLCHQTDGSVISIAVLKWADSCRIHFPDGRLRFDHEIELPVQILCYDDHSIEVIPVKDLPNPGEPRSNLMQSTSTEPDSEVMNRLSPAGKRGSVTYFAWPWRDRS